MKLSDASAKVLCAAVKYPLLDTKELGKIAGVSQWSVYKSMEKMEKRGIIKKIYIPDFKSMGFELLIAGYGSLTKRKMHTIDNIRKMPMKSFSSRIFYAFAESYKGFVLALAKSYTDYARSLIYAEKVIGVREILRGENVNIVFMPIPLTKLPILFDYSSLLCKHFGIKLEDMDYKNTSPGKIEELELKVMLELIKNPEITAAKISEKLGISIQKASRIKRWLEEERILIKRVIPNMKIFGYEVLAFAHWLSDPSRMEEIGVEDFKSSEYDFSNIVFLAYTPLEGIAMAVFRTLQESREIVNLFENFGEKMGVLKGEPQIIFLSLQEGIKMRDHDYSSLIEDLLGEQSKGG